MKYKVQELADLFKCLTYERSLATWTVEHAECDSRSVLHPAKTLFFALKGARTDGHSFIPQLIEQGVRVFVVAFDLPDLPKDVCVLKVPDVLSALQQLAIFHRTKFDIPVIGITGSNGKTIVKEWLYTILQGKYNVCKNPKSFNSQLGVALSVLELNDAHNIALFEAGISRQGEMQRLAEMIRANIGIFTNIGDAHQSGFSGMDEKTKEKLILFEHSEKLIYCKDYQSIDYHRKNQKQNICWSQKLEAPYKIVQLKKNKDAIVLELQGRGLSFSFHIHFQDDASLENIMHCIVVALELGLTESDVQNGINQLQNLSMRLEQKEGINGCLLINDSYSLDLKSLQLALQFVDQQNQDLPRTLVITDFAEHRDHSELFSGLEYLMDKYLIQKVITVGHDIAELQEHTKRKNNFFAFRTTEELLAKIDDLHFHNELILIKGARKFALERFFHQLSLSKHDTILEIDLKAVAHNLDVYRSLLLPGTQIMAIVKAAAYGSGHYEIARLLEHKKVDYLAVAYLDEGILLRQKGIQIPVMVMNTGTADFNSFLEYHLEPEIFSIQQLERCLLEIGSSTFIPIHIKLDTGMHRLGFLEQDLPQLIQILRKHPQIQVKSIFTHLAASDQQHFDSFTNYQSRLFESMAAQITKVLNYQPAIHALNSGGISRHPGLNYSMVRLGIGLYGFDNEPQVQMKLEKVHTLKTRISQIKTYAAGETVSYNRSGVISKTSKIAVLSIGYADGLPRSAGLNAYQLWINRHKVPLIGLVCMDMCMVDLSEIDHVSEGMEVEVFGKNAPLEELAHICDTIPYEILARISGRVKRLFLQD